MSVKGHSPTSRLFPGKQHVLFLNGEVSVIRKIVVGEVKVSKMCVSTNSERIAERLFVWDVSTE